MLSSFGNLFTRDGWREKGIQFPSTSSQGGSETPVFSILSPQTIYPNQIYNMVIFLEKQEQPLVLRINISCGKKHNYAEKCVVSGGEMKMVGISINELPITCCRLSVEVESNQSKKQVDLATKNLYVGQNYTSILIQLDKPIYKPGETVKYRIIVLDRQLRPITGEEFEIKISDSQQNVIRLHKNEKISNGMFSGEMILSKEPNLGNWEICAKIADKMEKESFSVEEYVLPTFKVEVNLPKYITYETKKIKAEIKATYTYGKGVKGQLLVKVFVNGNEHKYKYEYKSAVSISLDGSTVLEIFLSSAIGSRNRNCKNFQIEATVIEDATGKCATGTSSVTMYQYPYRIDVIDQSSSYKPGLEINYTFKISLQDGTPITDSRADAFILHYQFPNSGEYLVFKSSIPSTGLVPFSVIIPLSAVSLDDDNISPSYQFFQVKVTAEYKDLKVDFSFRPIYLESPSATYIQAIRDGENSLTIKSTKPMKVINYLAIAGDNIIDSGRRNYSEAVTETTLNLSLNEENIHGSKITIVVFSLFGIDNEVVGDSITYDVKAKLSNYLSIQLSNPKVEPGENILLSLRTNPKSTVALRGVDQSVLLLKEDKNIDYDRISKVRKIKDARVYIEEHWRKGFFDAFKSLKFVVITNGYFGDPDINRLQSSSTIPMSIGSYFNDLKSRYLSRLKSSLMEKEDLHGRYALDLDIPEKYGALLSVSSQSGRSTLMSPLRVRENFPESWIWETIEATDTAIEISKTVPDTLTSWVLTGFSLNSELGIGVTLNPQILETFRPFFISLNLPFSVVKGEILNLQILLHNYLNEEITGVVVLKNEKKEFNILERKTMLDTSMQKPLKLLPHEVRSITIPIVPVKVGEIKLQVEARTTMAGDAISQFLTVKPRGDKILKNSAVLLDVKSGIPQTMQLSAVFPDKRVEDGDSVRFSVVGDLLGSTIANLDSLIQMPCGCGEQNMLNFVPDIVILDYLTASGTLTPEIKRKAVNFLEIGYQRQLTYRHSDGSFSAWGKSNSVGSTWLTAFVVRSFISARRYISIDENIIKDSLKYLSRLQTEEGNFVENGRVLYLNTSGSGSGVALTAYVLLAFLEAVNFPEYRIIEKAVTYLSNQLSGQENSYTIILVCYALHLANSRNKDTAFKKVEHLSQKHESGQKIDLTEYINSDTSSSSNISQSEEQRPVSVEMTAYCLLIYILRDERMESNKIAKWLVAQRNAKGGFLSTQDTIVGLTALAKYEELIHISRAGSKNQMQVILNYKNGTHQFDVTDDNKMVLQEHILPSDTTEVSLTASGMGLAMAQLSWRYYLDRGVARPSFSITPQVKISDENENIVELKICSVFMEENESNMAVMEVSLPSGFVFESESLPHLMNVKNLMRFEEENDHTKLNIYFNFLTNSETFVELQAIRLFEVEKLAPSSILIYDYYETTKKARVFYEADLRTKPATIKTVDVEDAGALHKIYLLGLRYEEKKWYHI